MFSSKNGGLGKGPSSVESSLHGLAKVLAAMAALIAWPALYDLTAPVVAAYFMENYGNRDLADIAGFLFSLMATSVVYFICSAILILSLMLLATRGMMMLA